MKLLHVGGRPQFVKLASSAEAFPQAGIDHVVLPTGQHPHTLASPDIDQDMGCGR